MHVYARDSTELKITNAIVYDSCDFTNSDIGLGSTTGVRTCAKSPELIPHSSECAVPTNTVTGQKGIPYAHSNILSHCSL